MNVDTMKFGFETVEIKPRNRNKRVSEVWLLQGAKGVWNQVYISRDVIEKCGWKTGTRLELMKSQDGRTLAFKAVEHGCSFEVRFLNSTSARINSADLARTMRALMSTKYGANCNVSKFKVQVIDGIAVLTPEFDEL